MNRDSRNFTAFLGQHTCGVSSKDAASSGEASSCVTICSSAFSSSALPSASCSAESFARSSDMARSCVTPTSACARFIGITTVLEALFTRTSENWLCNDVQGNLHRLVELEERGEALPCGPRHMCGGAEGAPEGKLESSRLARHVVANHPDRSGLRQKGVVPSD